MINCLRTEKNEIYRILTYVVLNSKVFHKYYFDIKINEDFSYVECKKLGIKDKEEWNEDPMVVDQEKLTKIISRYLENFIPCENSVYVTCWKKDLDIVNELFVKKSDSLVEHALTHEEHFLNIFGIEQDRDSLINELNLKNNPEDLFEDLEIDYQIWSQTT